MCTEAILACPLPEVNTSWECICTATIPAIVEDVALTTAAVTDATNDQLVFQHNTKRLKCVARQWLYYHENLIASNVCKP